MPGPLPRRRRLRLADFDYATPGFYLVTACTDRRRLLFGVIDEAGFKRSSIGRIVEGV